MLRNFLKWVFKSELENLEKLTKEIQGKIMTIEEQQKRTAKVHAKFIEVLDGIDVSVDVHEYSPSKSWAVISLQGRKTDYIKFVDLRDSDIREISQFLRIFERSSNLKIDASPPTSKFLKLKS